MSKQDEIIKKIDELIKEVKKNGFTSKDNNKWNWDFSFDSRIDSLYPKDTIEDVIKKNNLNFHFQREIERALQKIKKEINFYLQYR